jgi:thiol-disulfide isomerase/thioredoxin
MSVVGEIDKTKNDAVVGSGSSSVTICDSQKGGKVASVAKLVKEKRIPTIIFIHADWCGHCQHTRPEWDKFVEKLSVLPRAKGCAAMAVEESSLPEFQQVMHPEIQGFPTILFTKSGDENFKEFSGM